MFKVSYGDVRDSFVDYFNPRPIHVSRGELKTVTTAWKLIVELRDAGYLGSPNSLCTTPPQAPWKGCVFRQD